MMPRLPLSRHFVLVLCLVVHSTLTLAQPSSRDHAVMTGTDRSFGQVAVSWLRDSIPTTYYVRVRSLANQPWRDYDTLTETAPYLGIVLPSFDHTEVEIEKRNIGANGKPLSAVGYWLGRGTGNLLRWTLPGRVLLMIDDEAATSLRDEVEEWKHDVLMEGWTPQVRSLLPSERNNPRTIKNIIINAYSDTIRGKLTHVLLVGDIPYAYSGGFSSTGAVPPPDGHPEHGGAWSSDAYYGDVEVSPGISAEESWTDDVVNDTTPFRPNNKNVAGDGKFDQSLIPSDLELAVGRIDMRQLPNFGTRPDSRSAEMELLRRVFRKTHAYRTRSTELKHVAVIDDNFGPFENDAAGGRTIEAFAASAWRGYSTIVGPMNVMEGDFLPGGSRPSLDTLPALLAYACGGGGYEHCTGVATSLELASATVRAGFIWTLGSYYADVDSENNFLRSLLATEGNVVGVGWSGRPHFQFHYLNARSTVGEMTVVSQNDASEYRGATVWRDSLTPSAYRYGNRGIHLNHLGDPTLRMPAPVMTGNITVSTEGNSVRLRWPTHPEAFGYAVDVGRTIDEPFTPLLSYGVGAQRDSLSLVVELPANTRLVRIRPILGNFDTTTFTPVVGRGLLASVPVTSVFEYNDRETVDDMVGGKWGDKGSRETIDAYFDVLGRQLLGPPTRQSRYPVLRRRGRIQ